MSIAATSDMEIPIISVAVLCGIGAFLTMTAIVRDVLPSLGNEEQARLRSWLCSWGRPGFDRALRKAWAEHVRLFPESWKRLLLGCFLLGSVLLVMSCPLWLTFARR